MYRSPARRADHPALLEPAPPKNMPSYWPRPRARRPISGGHGRARRPIPRRGGRGGAGPGKWFGPPRVFFSLPTLSTALASNQTEADGGGYTGMAAEHLPPLYSNTHPQILLRHQSIPRQGAGGRGGWGDGEDVVAGGHTAPPGGTRRRGGGRGHAAEAALTLQR